MNHIRPLRRALVCVALLASFVLAGTATQAGAVFDSQERALTVLPTAQNQPAMYAGKVVWTDYRWGIPEIYLYDSTTGREMRLTNDAYWQTDPAIYGHRVVWTDNRYGKSEIFMYDLLTGKQTNLSNDLATSQQKPALDGRYVVWEDYSYFDANPNVVAYDLLTRTKKVLDPNNATQQDPAVAAGRVVWTDFRVSGGDIRLYDPATGKSVSMPAPAGTVQYEPSISENYVVWTDKRDGEPDVYLFDLVSTSAVPQPIGATMQREENPSVSGSRAAWVDYQNGNPDIFMYDIKTGVKQAVCVNASAQLAPTLSGGSVAWLDQRAGNDDVWMADVIPAGEPGLPRTTSGLLKFYAKTTGSTAVGFTGQLSPRHTAGTRPIIVEAYRYDGADWVKKVSTRVAVSDYSVSASTWKATLALAPPGKWAIRAVHPDDGTHAYGESLYRNITIVAPKPYLSTPAPSVRATTASRYFRVSGIVKPAHASGKVRIQCYQLNFGKYVLKKTVSASCSPTSGSYSKYGASMRLPRGTWKFRAQHPDDAWHAAATTGLSVTVVVR